MRTRSPRSRGRPGRRVVVQPNVWAPAWRFLHGTYTVGRGLPFTWPLFHRPLVTLVYHVLARLNRAPAYRAIVVVDRPRSTAASRPGATTILRER